MSTICQQVGEWHPGSATHTDGTATIIILSTIVVGAAGVVSSVEPHSNHSQRMKVDQILATL